MTKVLKLNPEKPDQNSIAEAAACIDGGGIVAFPTETVYGLAVNRVNAAACERLYTIKQRPAEKRFTVHIASHNELPAFGVRVTECARVLMDRYWPGPLTLIFTCENTGDTIAFRMSSNSIARELLQRTKVAVVAPSANISGCPPASDANAVLRDFDNKIDMVLDGGTTQYKTASTIIDVSKAQPKIIRQGALIIDKGIW